MEAVAIKAHEIFKKHFSAEEAEVVMAWKDESLSKWVASKEDVANVRGELKKDIAILREDMAKLEILKPLDHSGLLERLLLWLGLSSL